MATDWPPGIRLWPSTGHRASDYGHQLATGHQTMATDWPSGIRLWPSTGHRASDYGDRLAIGHQTMATDWPPGIAHEQSLQRAITAAKMEIHVYTPNNNNNSSSNSNSNNTTDDADDENKSTGHQTETGNRTLVATDVLVN
ncbi:hypothetical protein PoB_007539500 [Plakobranchus ocellatus]|uniref:Uncharacterized protein n=1 Tax=Plakobranchus ocellatus TaxID=259542 RepID=A0AAV4DY08_9GAST|nr:hypothetical protein PoB_007539500 [Plakobranchus ocellatus]